VRAIPPDRVDWQFRKDKFILGDWCGISPPPIGEDNKEHEMEIVKKTLRLPDQAGK